MRKSIYTYAIALVLPIVALMTTSCEPGPILEDHIHISQKQVDSLVAADHGTIYTLNEFLNKYMTDQGNYWSDSSLYRTRANNEQYAPGVWLFTVDTIPSTGDGIYIRGRVSSEDFAGNYYKSLVIQQVVDGHQQNLRISVDLGSTGGMFQIGQEILLRCNGLAVGRYANQPQLCVPSYNNNIYAQKAAEKVGWAPGRIPGSVFRLAVKLIGLPNPNELRYDVVSIKDILLNPTMEGGKVTVASMKEFGQIDGLLVELRDVCFTGQYDSASYAQDFLPCYCNTNDPEVDGNANVFAPTTNNIGYPQSRLIKDAEGNMMNVSNSEYAKFARMYLPGADKNGVTDCVNWKGTVRGILGFYMDNARDFENASKGFLKYKWSVTPRGIRQRNNLFGLWDITMQKDGIDWEPKEYDPNDK